MVPDRIVRQRVPRQRMVRSLGSPPLPLALALPYRDARSQHRPTSDPVQKRNVCCPGNLLHSGQPFAEEPHLRGAVRGHPQSRVPSPQQPQVDKARFGERTLRCPKLLRPFPVPRQRTQLAFALTVLMSRPRSLLGQNRKSSTRAHVFRCSPNNGHCQDTSAGPLRARSGLMHRSKQRLYSIISSAATCGRGYRCIFFGGTRCGLTRSADNR